MLLRRSNDAVRRPTGTRKLLGRAPIKRPREVASVVDAMPSDQAGVESSSERCLPPRRRRQLLEPRFDQQQEAGDGGRLAARRRRRMGGRTGAARDDSVAGTIEPTEEISTIVDGGGDGVPRNTETTVIIVANQ
jgi:hypothetical protein